MNKFSQAPIARTLNAKVGAIAFAAGALMTLLLSHFTAPLAPLRLLALAIAAFAAWSFCDEMGMRKPLNRAGFVFFVLAVMAKAQIAVGVSVELVDRYYLLYCSFILAAVLFWSVALLHRDRTLKIVGALGAAASVVPILAILVGHIVLGTGAFLGVGALLSATDGTQATTLG